MNLKKQCAPGLGMLIWSLAGVALVPCGARAQFANHAESAPDKVRVFYPQRDCRGEQIELEVWNRAQREWVPHPEHARVPVGTCQDEDAGRLLNEIRWRCVEPADSIPTPVWVVGLEVFDPEVVESCLVDAVRFASGRTRIHISSPPPGRPFLSDQHEVSVRGSVRLHGIDGSYYDVVIAVDRSRDVRRDEVDRLGVQIRAITAFVERLEQRLGNVRVGIISYPNVPPRPGENAGARREIALGADRAALLAALAGLRARDLSGMTSFSSALEYGLGELRGRNSGSGARNNSRKVLIVVGDGRGGLPYGDAADRTPGFAARNLELAKQARREGVMLHFIALAGFAEVPSQFMESMLEYSKGTFTRVPLQALDSPFLGAISLPTVEEVTIENETTGRGAGSVQLDPDGSFEGTVTLLGGENRLRIRARTSEDEWFERNLVVDFDDALIVQKMLTIEAERMRRLQRKKLEVEAEP